VASLFRGKAALVWVWSGDGGVRMWEVPPQRPQ